MHQMHRRADITSHQAMTHQAQPPGDGNITKHGPPSAIQHAGPLACDHPSAYCRNKVVAPRTVQALKGGDQL